jgi:hypothetical protein
VGSEPVRYLRLRATFPLVGGTQLGGLSAGPRRSARENPAPDRQGNYKAKGGDCDSVDTSLAGATGSKHHQPARARTAKRVHHRKASSAVLREARFHDLLNGVASSYPTLAALLGTTISSRKLSSSWFGRTREDGRAMRVMRRIARPRGCAENPSPTLHPESMRRSPGWLGRRPYGVSRAAAQAFHRQMIELAPEKGWRHRPPVRDRKCSVPSLAGTRAALANDQAVGCHSSADNPPTLSPLRLTLPSQSQNVLAPAFPPIVGLARWRPHASRGSRQHCSFPLLPKPI